MNDAPRPLRSTLPALLLSTYLSTMAFAQVAPAPQSEKAPAAEGGTVKLDVFVTTGSSIKRTDSEKVLPVTVFNTETIEARDSTTSLDLLSAIPQITNIPANETSTNAVASRGGNASAALRGLGAENTLVLLNGRRVPFNPISGGPPWLSVVNINTLPTVGLQQIEVLRDGASAVYGTDAVAGVINYITKKDSRGGTAVLRYGVTEHGGGMDIQGTINYGFEFAGGKGRWVTTISAYYRDSIFLREREISKSANHMADARAPWNITGSIYDGRSATSQYASFRLGTGAVTGTVYWLYPVNGTPAITTTALPRDLYADYNQYTTGQPQTARYNIYSSVEYDLTPNLTAFVDVLGYMSRSQTGRQPITLNSSDALVTLSADNPYNPFGSAFYSPTGANGKITGNPQAITVTSKLLTDGGPEKIEASDAMFRLLGGVKGTIGASTWNWETAALYGEYKITDDPVNSIRESLLKQAALRTTADAYNPFGYTFKVSNGAVVVDQPYTNPANVRDYYTDSAKRIGHSKLASLDLRTNGEVFELWAGPIAAAAGAEWRYELKSDWKPAYVSTNPENNADPNAPSGNNDILVMSPKYNYTASRTVASAYAETIVPLTSPKNDVPFVNNLEANASIRFESFSDFGETTKPKFGINYRPVKAVMIRASYNEGFHAPDLTTMNQPTSFSVASPPGNRDTVRNNYFTGAGLAADTQVLNKTYTIPSPNLQPEESEGLSAGVVVDVPGVKGLSFSVDYWEIEQKNLAFSQTRDAAVDEALLRAYTQAQLAAGKDILSINTGSRLTADGANTYVGDPYTLRAPVTADDIARFQATYSRLPQSQWIAPVGEWLGATTQIVNGTGKAFTNGFDYEIDYSLPKTPIGQFRFTTTWSQFLNKFRKDTPNDIKDDDIVAMLLPEWRSSTTVQWRKGPWSATANATYQSDIRTNVTTNLAGYTNAGSPSYIRVVSNNGSVFYYEEGQDTMQVNVGVSYAFGKDANRWLRGTTVRLGINNLFDDEPPLVAANEAGTSANVTGYAGSNGTSLWVGRAYSLTLTRAF